MNGGETHWDGENYARIRFLGWGEKPRVCLTLLIAVYLLNILVEI